MSITHDGSRYGYMLCFLGLMLFPSLHYAQSNPGTETVNEAINQFLNSQFNAPSAPQADEFGKYGRFPVNYFQGGVNVAVPLHSYQCASFTLPLSLEYQTTGLMVNQIDSWVGLGWSLVPGGVITRQVRGYPDQDDNYFYQNIDPPPTYVEDWALREYEWKYDALRGEIEIQPDIFRYNFLGYSGEFVLSTTYAPRFKNYEDFTMTVIAGGPFPGDIARFEITTREGLRLFFDVKEETETYHEPSSESQTNPVLNYRKYGSAWYLSRIEGPNNIHVAMFNYTTVQNGPTDFNHLPRSVNYTYIDEMCGQDCPQNTPAPDQSFSLTGIIPEQTSVQVLESITFSAGSYQLEKWLFISDPTSSAEYGRLKSIEIYGSSASGTIGNRLRTLSFEFNPPSGIGRRYLESVSTIGANGEMNDIPPYEFTYYYGFPDYTSEEIDHWGYYNNGGTGLIPNQNGYYGENTSRTSGEYTNGMLTQIKYPTGGYTSFTYEGHKNANFEYIGGLRIQSMTDYRSGSPITRRFYYETESETSSLVDFHGTPDYFRSTSFYYYPPPNTPTCPVFGCIVVESRTYSLTSHAESYPGKYHLGYRYGYSRVVEDLGEYGKNVYYFNTSAPSNNNVWSIRTGDLIKKESYDRFSNLCVVKENKYNYDILGSDSAIETSNTYTWSIDPLPDQDTKIKLCCSGPTCVWEVVDDDQNCPGGYCPVGSQCGIFKVRYDTAAAYVIRGYRKNLVEETITTYAFNYLEEVPISAGSIIQKKVYEYQTLNLPTKETFYHGANIIDEIQYQYVLGKPSKRTSLHTRDADFHLLYGGSSSCPNCVFPKEYKTYESSGWITHVKLLDYDQLGNPTSIERSDMELPEFFTWNKGLITQRSQGNWIWTYNYDYNSRKLTSITDMNGQVVTFGYDGFQRLDEDEQRDGNITSEYTYTYNLNNSTLNYRDRDVTITGPYIFAPDEQDKFDALGDLIVHSKIAYTPDGKDDEIATKYDALGRVVSESSTANGKTSYAYEPRPDGKIIRTFPPGYEQEWEHIKTIHGIEADGYKTTTINENGNITESYTDLLGRTTKVNNEGANTLYQYDDWGNVLKIIPPDCNDGEPCQFTFTYYDQNHRQIKTKTIPGYGQIIYNYQQNPYRLSSVVEPSGTTSYSYNSHDQVTSIDGLGKTFEYYNESGPKLGKLYIETSISLDGAFSTIHTYDYDNYGRVSSVEVKNHLEGIDTYSYVYDILDNTRELTHVHDGYSNHTIHYLHEYDHGSRLTKSTVQLPYVGTHIIEKIDYDGRSRVAKLKQGVLANSEALQEIDYGYHDRGWLETISNPDAVGRKYLPPQGGGGGGGEIPEFITPAYRITFDNILGFICPKYTVMTYQTIIPELNHDETTTRHLNSHLINSPDNGNCQGQAFYDDLAAGLLLYLQTENLNYEVEGCDYIVHEIGFDLILHLCEPPSIEIHITCGDRVDPREDMGCDYDLIEQLTILALQRVIEFLTEYFSTHSACCAFQINPDDLLGDILSLLPDMHDNTNHPPIVIPGSSLFALHLHYDRGSTDLQGDQDEVALPRYNGDVAWMEWETPMGANQYYGFEYDELNRLTRANYSSTGFFLPEENEYGTTYEYQDKRGNMKWITRRGLLAISPTSPQYGLIDSLRMTYNDKNQIQNVLELASPYKGHKLGGPYTHDHGNVIQNPKCAAEYNILNLPDFVTFQDGSTIEITYDGDGNVLRKVIISTHDTLPNGEMSMQVDYVEGFMYVDQVFQSYTHSQGRVNKGKNGTRNEYFLLDHLGNTRVVYSDLDNDGIVELDTVLCELLEENHYYPFGMQFDMVFDKEDTITMNRYRYNGKELQKELEWDWYNYGARYYDASMGRFISVDPIADYGSEYSPYVYTFNNPVKFMDPDGRWPWPPGAGAAINKWFKNKWNDYRAGANGLKNAWTMASGQEPTFVENAMIEVHNFVDQFGSYTSQNDVAVLGTGHNWDGSRASGFDKAMAGLFIALPVSGSAVTKGLKYGLDNASDFYKSVVKLSTNDRIAQFKAVGAEFAEKNGLVKNNALSKLNDRTIYTGENGTHYSLDTQHGHFEVLDSKGKHQGSIKFDGSDTGKGAQNDHDIKIK